MQGLAQSQRNVIAIKTAEQPLVNGVNLIGYGMKPALLGMIALTSGKVHEK